MRNKPIDAAMNRLADAESAFLGAEYLAPVVLAGVVTVQIANIRCTLRALPADFRGWGVFQPVSHVCARLVRPALKMERRRYLDLLPEIRLIVVGRGGEAVMAVAANGADRRFQIAGHAPVQLAGDVEMFDTVLARFDGSRFWFDEMDARADPAVAGYLRRALSAMAQPADLARPGLTAAHRQAYGMHFARRMDEIQIDRRQREESRLQLALAQAGARLHDFSEVDDSYRVMYIVDGTRHVSLVGKKDLTIRSAGICLSGHDRAFDLNSLVGVLREGASVGRF